MEVRWTPDDYAVETSHLTLAPPEAVYRLLADLHMHMRWGGSSNRGMSQYLLSMEAPQGLATAGTRFTTEGHTPSGIWRDHSEVTIADPARRFAFVTRGELMDLSDVLQLTGTWTHSYRLEARAEGCTIHYRCSARLAPHPHPHPIGRGRDAADRLPLILFRLVIPGIIAKGVENLAALAAEEALVEP